MFNDSVAAVTGGTGTWGSELVRQLLSEGTKKVVVLSRNETSQVEMRRAFDDPRLNFCICDIRDKKAVASALVGVDYVFHLAALKHVHICEEHPLEALKTNVIGTQNVIEAAIENGVKKVINASTDKAVDPTNFYGMTKAVAEKLMVYANLLDLGTKFINVRSGNILGSNGSVLNLFLKDIYERNQVSITDRRMTRFFLTKEESAKLVLKAAMIGNGGEIFVMNLPACRIIDLAEVLIEESGKTNVNIVECGVRPGEKLDEKLISSQEVQKTFIYDKDCLVVLPDIPGLRQHYSKCVPVKRRTYSSGESSMTKTEIKQMLVDGGFLKG
ncbi:polysaccharide biosynthesis protein [Alicyclobacillus dauci]|uniref:Polysaccharide biosynthesis protein n=1 Tax=Alicyclobacillus dauci TaxID=1475485 RepID=A0ABY6Z4C9_9BACL|nr:polysaccharide biosynthesis protein [Alicyclobacillus dauci]WAH37522.1 polysaccharide biosynthesis protein [Alicyclobacillus dauci]